MHKEVFERVKDIFSHCNDKDWRDKNNKNNDMLIDLAKLTAIIELIPRMSYNDIEDYYLWYDRYDGLRSISHKILENPFNINDCVIAIQDLNIYSPEVFAARVAVICDGIAHAIASLGFEYDDLKREVENQATCIFNLLIGNYVLKEDLNKDIKGDD